MLLELYNSSNKEIGICYDNKLEFISPSSIIKVQIQNNKIAFFINEQSYIKRNKTDFKLLKNIDYFDGYVLKVEALYQIESTDEIIQIDLELVKGINEDIFSDISETYEVIVPYVKKGKCILLSLKVKDKDAIYDAVKTEEKQKIETAVKNAKMAKKVNVDRIYKVFLIFSLASPIAFFAWIFMHEYGIKNKFVIFLVIATTYMIFAVIATIGNKTIDLLISLSKRKKKSNKTKKPEEKTVDVISSQLNSNIEKIFDEKHIRSVLQKSKNKTD